MNEGGGQYRVEEAKQAEPQEKRRCVQTAMGGRRCRRRALEGEELCLEHVKYAETCASSRIEVPLLEDEASILFVLSQAARAVATGAIPPGNGNAVIGACRLATHLLEMRRKQEKEKKHAASPETAEVRHPADEQIPMSPNAGDMGHPAMGAVNPSDPEETPEADELVGDEMVGGQAVGSEGPLMAVADEAYDGGAAGQRAFEQARARVEAAEAERYEREGPKLNVPRFRKEDLQKQWDDALMRHQNLKHNNWWPSSEESEAMLEWRRLHPEIVRAQRQRELDEYFGRVKKDGTPAGGTGQR